MDFIIGVLGRIVSPLFNRGIGKVPGVLPLYKRLWGRFGYKGIRLTRVDNFKMYIICRDWAVAPTMLFAHSWEPEETRICRECVKEGMTVVDVGAYIGYYSLLTSRLVGDKGKVYAFEPSPESLSILRKNIKINNCKNIEVVEKALTDKAGYASYYLVHDNPSNSSIMQSLKYRQQIIVPTTTLDEVVGDKRIDFIKMDIEGGERLALYGMTKVIRNNPNLQMVIEVYPAGLKRAGWNLKEFIEYLQCPFHLYIIRKSGLASEVGFADVQKAIDELDVINLFCRRRGSCV